MTSMTDQTINALAAGASAASRRATSSHAGIADPLAWIAGTKVDDAGAVTEKILSFVLQDDATREQRATLLSYLQTDAVGNMVELNGENIDEKVRGATSLAFSMPSYQLM